MLYDRGYNTGCELVGEACSSSVFFQCEDQKVELLYDILKKVGDTFSQIFPPSIFLTLHASPSYLGFFIDDSQANILKDFAVAFSTEASALAGRTNTRGKMGGLQHKCVATVLNAFPVSPGELR